MLKKINFQKGFSAVEVLLSAIILGILVSTVFGAVIYVTQNTNFYSNRQQAILLASEGIEAVRNIRDNSFSDLIDGTYGLDSSLGNYELITSTETNNGFTREITISSVNSNIKQIKSKVFWTQNNNSEKQVLFTTYLSNWKSSLSTGSCSQYCVSIGSYTSGTCRQNLKQCSLNNEIYESNGDQYCTAGPSADTCCCK